ncbi:AzlC family ABC transporter permease [Nitrincola alkalilacustris]|uniref:AzlC family ABC transporter permease n=1 Tax=Nitrincola alkalilacustris TaxID=1571224 RepID=UPI0019803E9D|nr:AzlC family ABC transporter permease [Nitrincola alkalilacustris]
MAKISDTLKVKPSGTCIGSALRAATLDIMPLAVAVFPWGILCGSLALQSGLSPIQAQFMSLVVFAGAAQLAALGLISGGSGNLAAIVGSTAVVSARHLLYSAVFRPDVLALSLRWRLALAFLLTDEMFAVTSAHKLRTGCFSPLYALTAGLTFYIVWNAATLTGILLGSLFTGIEHLGFDFAIAVTFIAMVVPAVNTRPMLIAVLISGLLAVMFQLLQVQQGLLLASLIGMSVGYLLSRNREV